MDEKVRRLELLFDYADESLVACNLHSMLFALVYDIKLYLTSMKLL